MGSPKTDPKIHKYGKKHTKAIFQVSACGPLLTARALRTATGLHPACPQVRAGHRLAGRDVTDTLVLRCSHVTKSGQGNGTLRVSSLSCAVRSQQPQRPFPSTGKFNGGVAGTQLLMCLVGVHLQLTSSHFPGVPGRRLTLTPQ